MHSIRICPLIDHTNHSKYVTLYILYYLYPAKQYRFVHCTLYGTYDTYMDTLSYSPLYFQELVSSEYIRVFNII